MKNAKLTHLITAAYLTFAVGNTSLVYADDTEIYLNVAAPAGSSNVLFSLDTSGSMGDPVDENNNGVIDAGERPRIVVLKEAMATVLDSLPPLNAGVMRYHYYGGPILYPVANVDEFACVIEGNCTTSSGVTGIQAVTNTLTNGSNDAEQEGALTVNLNRPALDVGTRSGSTCSTQSGSVSVVDGDDDAESDVAGSTYVLDSTDLEIPREDGDQQIVGLRFQNVPIPAGAAVIDARIVFQVDATPSSYNAPIDINIVGENMAGGRGKFSGTDLPKARLLNPTSAIVAWETGEFPGLGQLLTTNNISAILNELVNDPTWSGATGDDIVLLLSQDPTPTAGATGSRELESGNGDGDAPVLTFTYQTCASATSTEMRTGLRFTNVAIPQGATITGARIDFTNTTSETGSNPELRIRMQDTDDAEAFTTTSPLTSRTMNSSAVPWLATSTPALSGWDPVDSTYSTPDMTPMVQAVVNRSGWCGGNAMMFMIDRTGGDAGLRTAYSVEGDSTKAPVLTVTYDADVPIPTGGGCARSTIVRTITAPGNDAEEHAGGVVDTGSSDLEMVQESDTQVVGLRFMDIPVVQGTIVTDAKLVFTADEPNDGTTSLAIHGQLSDDAVIFSTSTNDITDTTSRPRTVASVAWNAPEFAVVGQVVEVAGLEGIIQEIVNLAGWAAGNSLALFVSGSGKRVADAYDGDPATAPRLVITFEGDPDNTKKTVRRRLKEIVGELTQAGGTPIAGAMLEAAYYFRGEDVRYGRQRGSQEPAYAVSRVSHSASYQAGGSTVTYPGSCADDNLNHPDCLQQVISGGTPKYKSPIVAECQANYLVQLTDGGGYYTANNLTNTQSQSIDEDNLINSLQAHDDDGDLVSLTGCASDTTLPDGTTFTGTSHDECTVKLAQFLHNNDQNYASTQVVQSGTAPLDGTQTIDIYNIGFNLCGTGNVTSVDSNDQQVCCAASNPGHAATGVCDSPVADSVPIKVLKAQSAVGGGEYFNANTVDELVAAFAKITSGIIEKSTSFVAPSIAANAFNRLFSRDEVYFGLFEPSRQAHWDGNVKKYKICTDPDPDDDGTDDCVIGDVLDESGTPAVVTAPPPASDPNGVGLFSKGAQSVWSAGIDGRFTKEGGAGDEITDYAQRTIYTEYSTNDTTAAPGTSLGGTGFILDSTNWDSAELSAIRDEVCPDPSVLTAGSDCEMRMEWLLGKDVQDEDDNASTDLRWWFHDVLHSSPVSVTYGKDASDNFIDKLLVATNDGALHFINGSTGEEEWAFMPRAVLSDQQTLFDDTAPAHIYGLDSTPIIGVHDVNLDGTIDPATDFVGAVITQRRGGSNMYALDLTPTNTLTSVSATVTPKFLWHISPSTTGFSRLGQTWSEPSLVTINTTSGPLSALIFGGGYDTDLDLDDGSGTAKNFGLEGGDPNTGNAIYVVNANTGALIFSVSSDAGATITVPDMKYAIPSNVTTFDADGDGYEDRVYVGDTAGQVWRVDLIDIDPSSALAPQGGSVVGRLAEVSTVGTPASERRFFYKPTVVQVVDTKFSDAAGGEYDYVLIGTGNRANPLDTVVNDRFYAFRDINIGTMADTNGDNIADAYPVAVDATDNGASIVESDLVDISDAVLSGADATTRTALGWFFDFDSAPGGNNGEKVLAGSSVFAGTLIFTTYLPDDIAAVLDPCRAAEGSGSAYNMNILSTAASLDWDADSSLEPKADRATSLGSGIPSEAVPIFTQEGVTVLVGTGGGAENLGKVTDLPRFNTYWYEEH